MRRIDQIFAIEREINGATAEQRLVVAQAVAALDARQAYLDEPCRRRSDGITSAGLPGRRS